MAAHPVRWCHWFATAICFAAFPGPTGADELEPLASAEVARLNDLYGTHTELRVTEGATTDSSPEGLVSIGAKQVRDLLAHVAETRPTLAERFIVGHEMAHQLQFRLYGRDVLSRDAEGRRVFECQADLLAAANLLPGRVQDEAQASDLAGVLQLAFDAGTEAYSSADHPDHEQRRLAVRFGLGDAAIRLLRAQPPAKRNVALEAEIARKLDLHPNEGIDDWSLRISKRIVHFQRLGVSALSLGETDINWDKRAQHPFVAFALPYTNTSSSTVHVEMEVATLLVPRFDKSDTSVWNRFDIAEYTFNLAPGERHIVSGQLQWSADDNHMPRLQYPPGAQTMVSAVVLQTAGLESPARALQLMGEASKPQSLREVITSYVNNPDGCYLRWRTNAAAHRTDFGSGDYSDDYTSSLPIPGTSDTEISKESDGSCEVDALVHTGRSREGALEAAQNFATSMSVALDRQTSTSLSGSGLPRFKIPVRNGDYYVLVSTSLRGATGVFTVRMSLQKADEP